MICKYTQTYIGEYRFGSRKKYDEKARDIPQKCNIAFYAEREILQISQRNLQDRVPNAQESEAQFDTEVESLVGTRQLPARDCAGQVGPM